VKKKVKDLDNADRSRRVLARVLAEDLYQVSGAATMTSLGGEEPDTKTISEAATSESIPD
jgi:hypothetical protein